MPERFDRDGLRGLTKAAGIATAVALVISLVGTVTSVDVRVSQRGNSYYTFKLDDRSGRVTVFSFGDAPCPEGSRVAVEGQFLRVKHIAEYTFYNQLDARQVACQ